MRVVNGSVGTQGPPPLDVNTGAGGNFVRLNTLQRWASITPSRPPADYSSMTGPRHSEPPFIEDQGLNKKIVLWHGDISTLEVDAITNTTNESLDEQNAISDRIYFRAGSALKEEIFLDVKECRTGDVKVTSGHDLHARYIIHTVGPKYNVKYQTAAETTLHMCYRNVLHKARELGAQSLAVCLVHSVKKNYPADLGAHIALRTIRRFLERYGSAFHTLAICGDGHQELSLVEALLPLYFPRNEAEERASRWRLPLDIGGSAGEPHLPDRQIRIIDNPQHSAMDAEDETIDVEGVNAAFGHMQGDLDKQRLLGDQRPQFDPVAEIMAREIEHQERYERLLRRAKTEDLTEVSGIGCLYQSGVDRLGRPVVIFVGKWFPFSNINLDKALLYLIALLDPIVKGDYVIAYFHTLTSNANYPSFAWLKEVYSILPYKYKKNLKAFYIVHPTIWTKMMTWWFTTFMAPAIKQKVHNLPGVEYLYSVMAPDQLEIPAYITEYDMTINGLHYFQPDISNT